MCLHKIDQISSPKHPTKKHTKKFVKTSENHLKKQQKHKDRQITHQTFSGSGTDKKVSY